MRKTYILLVIVLGLVACKKDNESADPNEVILTYNRASEQSYKVVTYRKYDDTTQFNNDSEETLLDTLVIKISADTVINSETFFKKTQIYKNAKDTIIQLVKETDSGYIIHATWNEVLQEFQIHSPEIDELKKFRANNSWYKTFIFDKAEYRITAIESILINNRPYKCAKVEPQLNSQSGNFKYNIYYGSNGIVKITMSDNGKYDFGYSELSYTVELL